MLKSRHFVISSDPCAISVLHTFDCQDFASLIGELFSRISEQLIPFHVNSICVCMCVSDIDGIIVVALVSDCFGLEIEVELLGGFSARFPHVQSVGLHIHKSVLSKVGCNVERSVDVHTPNFAVSFSWNWLSLVKIENIPLLVNLGVSILSNDWSFVSIKFALDCKDLSSLIYEPSFVIFEKLIPS